MTTLTWNGQKVKDKAGNTMRLSVKEMGLLGEAQAIDLCAVKYGYLKASINVQMSDWGTNLKAITGNEVPPAGHNVATFKTIDKPNEPNTALFGTVVDYGPYVEYGTRFADAQPFIRPAVDVIRGKAMRIVESHGRREFREYLK